MCIDHAIDQGAKVEVTLGSLGWFHITQPIYTHTVVTCIANNRTTIYLCFDTDVAKGEGLQPSWILQVLKRTHKSWPLVSMKLYAIQLPTLF
jgi:hypothetical protein